jgi:hypothetical protein
VNLLSKILIYDFVKAELADVKGASGVKERWLITKEKAPEVSP